MNIGYDDMFDGEAAQNSHNSFDSNNNAPVNTTMQSVASNNDSVIVVESTETESGPDGHLDPNNLRYETAPGKRRDFKLIFTKDEKQFYGRNKSKPNSDGEIPYLCRLYYSKKCKSRTYMKNGRLYRKIGFIPHNHGPQDEERVDFQAEFEIKQECANLLTLANAGTQTSAVNDIFDRCMQK